MVDSRFRGNDDSVPSGESRIPNPESRISGPCPYFRTTPMLAIVSPLVIDGTARM